MKQNIPLGRLLIEGVELLRDRTFQNLVLVRMNRTGEALRMTNALLHQIDEVSTLIVTELGRAPQ